MADDRAFVIHCARVFLAEAARRRRGRVNRDFYGSLFAAAQDARREAAAMERQGVLFA